MKSDRDGNDAKWRESLKVETGRRKCTVWSLQTAVSPLPAHSDSLYHSALLPYTLCTPLYFAVLCYSLLYSAILCCALLKGDWLSACSLVSCFALGLYYPDPAVLQAVLQTLNSVLCTSPAPLSRPNPTAMIFLCIEYPFPKGRPQNQSAYQIGDFELILVPRLFWKPLLKEAAVVFSNGFWYKGSLHRPILQFLAARAALYLRR